MYGKKGIVWWQLMAAIIALVVVILVLVWFSGGGSKAYGEVGKKLDQLGDCDGDNVANMFDKCPCDPVGSNPTFEGCPDGVKKNTDSEYGNTKCTCKK